MVLVNTLTVEAINTALIALQRGQSIVVGGEKPSTTVNNITISNGGGGSGGSGLDFTPQISALDKRVGLLEKAEEVLRLENERQNERLEALEGLGITDFYFDDTSRELTIELANGEVFDTEVTSESFSMEVVNGELIIRIGEQVHTVTLPMGSQADWTQTDSDDPSFIKHKIPIWITQGSADDNMSPIDSVTDGSMRPVTSNAVYDKHYLTSADITNQVAVDNMQSVSSNAVAIAINDAFRVNLQYYTHFVCQGWSNSHSYTINLEGNYLLICANPNTNSSAIYFIKGGHTTITSLVGYANTVMASQNVGYNINVNRTSLTITGGYCTTALMQIGT